MIDATDLIEVDLDTTDIGSTDRDHTEEAVLPSTEEGDAFIKDKEVLESFCHPRGYRK